MPNSHFKSPIFWFNSLVDNYAFTVGQYNEVNPGQYTLDDKDIEVDVNNRYFGATTNNS